MNKILKYLDSNRIQFFVFFSSLFILITFAGTRLFLSDEGVIIDQFYNLINGSLAIKIAKINTEKGIFILSGNNLYGAFSYSLLILSLPAYYILKIIDLYYSAHLFMLQLWAFSGGMVIYIFMKYRNSRYPLLAGFISYCVLIFSNWFLFKPIYFPKWGELLSIELTNIIITSGIAIIIFQLFRNFFGNKIAFFSSFFVILATPVSFYAVLLKHHSLTLFFTLVSIYYFYKHNETNDNRYIFLAYIIAGLTVWTRILDGSVLLITLLATDIFVLKKGNIKYISQILIIILISLTPFFIFNYLILGNPLSVMENTPLADRSIKIPTAKDFILLENQGNNKQIELLNILGYTWNSNPGDNLIDIFLSVLFRKLNNTFGLFLVSPFLIIALAFVMEKIKYKTRFHTMDKFFVIYLASLFGIYASLYVLYNIKPFISIITDTPVVLEYRYLLMVYIVLLYFTLRIIKIKELIEKEIKKIAVLYALLLFTGIWYFFVQFPMPVLDVYNYSAQFTLISLLMVISIMLFFNIKMSIAAIIQKLGIFLIALSLAEASFLMLFYYWVVSMTYVSQSQNFTILPVMEITFRWMYRMIF